MTTEEKPKVFIVVFDHMWAMPAEGSSLRMTRNPQNFRYFRKRKDALEAMKEWHPGPGPKAIKEILL